jgi:hypothetical protein
LMFFWSISLPTLITLLPCINFLYLLDITSWNRFFAIYLLESLLSSWKPSAGEFSKDFSCWCLIAIL